mmetsp:Transcript_6940/g.21596  ORF Transcript_6940/g.21596 Transcript_6940/m.21596 type:complete len:359 (-) Transcript_6940:3066-4142(-)
MLLSYGTAAVEAGCCCCCLLDVSISVFNFEIFISASFTADSKRSTSFDAATYSSFLRFASVSSRTTLSSESLSFSFASAKSRLDVPNSISKASVRFKDSSLAESAVDKRVGESCSSASTSFASSSFDLEFAKSKLALSCVRLCFASCTLVSASSTCFSDSTSNTSVSFNRTFTSSRSVVISSTVFSATFKAIFISSHSRFASFAFARSRSIANSSAFTFASTSPSFLVSSSSNVSNSTSFSVASRSSSFKLAVRFFSWFNASFTRTSLDSASSKSRNIRSLSASALRFSRSASRLRTSTSSSVSRSIETWSWNPFPLETAFANFSLASVSCVLARLADSKAFSVSFFESRSSRWSVFA